MSPNREALIIARAICLALIEDADAYDCPATMLDKLSILHERLYDISEDV